MTAEKAQLVLTLDEQSAVKGASYCAEVLSAALKGKGFVAVILPRFEMADHTYSELVSSLIPVIQKYDAAALLDDIESSQILGRFNADGLLLQCKGESWVEDCLDLVQRFDGEKSIGVYGNIDRDHALTIGDLGVDLIHFGPLARDIKPEPHSKNLKLAEWWAQMVEVPCLIPAGNQIDSLEKAFATHAEFVVVSRAVLAADDIAKAAEEAVQMIEKSAPELYFED